MNTTFIELLQVYGQACMFLAIERHDHPTIMNFDLKKDLELAQNVLDAENAIIKYVEDLY